MLNMKIRATGERTLLMHNSRLANPLDPFTKELKACTSKRKKTDDDLHALARAEFMGGLYHDAKVGPYIPGLNIAASIENGARLSKRGKDVKRGLQVLEDKAPLQYDGPRDPGALFADPRFVDMRIVGVQRAKVMRTRPCFHEWAIDFTIAFDEEVWNDADVLQVLVAAGRYCGLGDFRPMHGVFSVDVLEAASK